MTLLLRGVTVAATATAVILRLIHELSYGKGKPAVKEERSNKRILQKSSI